MKNKDLALRVLSTAATLSIVTSMAASAFAGSYNLKNGSVDVRVDKDSSHYVKQGENKEKKDEDGKVTITSDGEETSNTITVDVEEGGKADITLKDANVKSSTDAAMKIKGDGDVDIELDGDNKLTSGSNKDEDNSHAGLEKNDSDSKGKLTIKDDIKNDGKTVKSDDEKKAEWAASAEGKTGGEVEDVGKLTVTGGGYGAGIGGSGGWKKDGESTSNITIKGGSITAGTKFPNTGSSGLAAGIGGGGSGSDSGTGGNGGAEDRSGDITIDGGSINANGIGGGYGKNKGGDGYVTINDGYVKSSPNPGSSGGSGAAIGGGYSTAAGGDGHVTINGGHVEASASRGAAIGGGKANSSNEKYKAGDGDVLITGGVVEANNSTGGAGIGGGFGGTGGNGTVTITGGNVTATVKSKENGGAGIGGGRGVVKGGDGNVTITGEDTVIEKASGSGGAGIGGGKSNSNRKGGDGDVEISDGALVKEAVGDGGSAGIGGGRGNDELTGEGGGAGRVTIKDSTVWVAKGSKDNFGAKVSGAGIGNGGGGASTADGSVEIINSVIGKLVKDENDEPKKDAEGNYIIKEGTGAIAGSERADAIGNGEHGNGRNSSVAIDEKSIVAKNGSAAHQHTVDSWTETPATCARDGVKTGKCTGCGDTVTSVIPATGKHSWDSGKVTKEPDCTEKGEKTFTCTVCNTTKKEDIKELGHQYTVPKEHKDVTCTEDGYDIFQCSRCDATEKRNIVKATEHHYNDTVVAPTCTERGYTLHTCVNGDDEYKDSYTDVLGHQYTVLKEHKDATCTENGYDIFECVRGDDTKTVILKATEHHYNDTVVAPTCTEGGYTLHTCVNGDDEYKDSYTDALGHQYTVLKEHKDATCTEDGYDIFQCSRCEATEKRNEAEASGHKWSPVKVDATCTTDGYTEEVCETCGAVQNHVDIKADGHHYVDTVVAPTCTEGGYTLHTCVNGDDEYKDAYTEAAGHHYVDTVVEPTCTEGGYTVHTCDKGDDSYTDKTAPLGHEMGDWQLVRPATYDEAGQEMRFCQREGCDYVETRVVPQLVREADADDAAVVSTGLRVVNSANTDILRDTAQVQLVQVGGVLYIEAAGQDTAAVQGVLRDLSALMENDIQTIVFTTGCRVSTIRLAKVVVLGTAETPFELSHNGSSATLTVGGADHSGLIH